MNRLGSAERIRVLATEGVGMRFQGLDALSDVTMQLPAGSITGLIGPNGAGKTTLVNILSGLAAPTSGRVLLDGGPVSNWRLSTAVRAGVARTFQQSRFFGEFNVLENVELGALSGSTQVSAQHVLELMDLADVWSARPNELSYGQQRRLGVAIALATGPRVLLMDEPGAGLTGTDLERLTEVIQRVREEGTTLLLIDHNMRFLMGTVERVVVLESGRVIAEGTPMQIQADENVKAAYLGGGAHA